MAMPTVMGGKDFSVRVTGFTVVLRALELSKDQRKAIKNFLISEAEDVIDRAQETVPWDTGALHDTHRIGEKKINKMESSVDIRAGGMVAMGKFVNYALKVHNNDPWLQEAVDIQSFGFKERLAKTIKFYRIRGTVV